jgi:primosomal protein N' (replication factor Y)
MNRNLINVAFNLPIDSLFTYTFKDEQKDSIVIGKRVLVPFGKRNITGLITELPSESTLKNIKCIIKILDSEPLINDELLGFCKWVASYYMCPIGEVIFSALPKSMLVESKFVYELNTGIKLTGITKLHQEITEILKAKPLTLRQIEKKLRHKNLNNVLSLLTRNGLLLRRRISGRESSSKFEKFIVFNLLHDFKDFNSAMFDNFFRDSAIKSEKQKNAIKYLVQTKTNEISLKDFLKNTSLTSSAANSLAKKELIIIEKRKVKREIEYQFPEAEKNIKLNAEQQYAANKISESINNNEFKTFLLFGVTGSGKTQVYIEVIKKVIEQNKTAIVLVPEISLTPQLIHRFNVNFGNIIGVIHSHLSEGQRFDVTTGILAGEIKIVIGARSALFAPLKNIGIIVVDEEHDHSYKQTEKDPKYNARDSAIVRAKMNNAVCVLGSATPSLESYYNQKEGKYKLLTLPHRALKTRQPVIEIVDMLEELRKPSKFVKKETPEQRFLSSKLISYIHQALQKKHSVILLQNRRGYSAYQQCQECGNVKMCPNCDITLIYHKIKEHLRCHYCGHIEHLQTVCEKCGSVKVELKGTGTEKVEEEIQRLFPKARLKRMDTDTVRRKDAYRKILASFHEREFDILIGTQMISKGLDFPNVYLAGVISADIGLHLPDFRSHENTFQLLMQVAGRSGRSSDLGKVVIQTMDAGNYIFEFIKKHDYESFYEKESAYRKNISYPPFSRMILIEFSGVHIDKVSNASSRAYLFLRKHLEQKLKNNSEQSIEILKPAPAIIFKIKNRYRYHIVIKVSKQNKTNTALAENLVKELISWFQKDYKAPSVTLQIDIDPISFH